MAPPGYSNSNNLQNLPAVERILVPVDKTPLSTKASKYAIHLAELEKAKELIVMHVVEDVKQGGAIGLRARYGDVKLVEGFRRAKEQSAQELIQPIEEQAKRKGLNVKSEIFPARGKSVVNAITDYSKKNDIDLIVMGGGDMSKTHLVVNRSITNGVIKKVNCPVVVMR
jgi:nucleotide-binding universal stress UspA family protein